MGNLIRLSGQEWKLTAATVALVLTVVATLLEALGSDRTIVLSGLAILLTGSAAVALIVSVRCPACRRSLGFWSMKTQSPGRWYSALAGLDGCPYCQRTARS